ncbi:MAG: hypothetical protein EOO13_02330 [Chitinophagaceae bacterium]|nr:MAG: hypothetical protein EOO13_02330 [Chitinophagaceae bacterium]
MSNRLKADQLPVGQRELAAYLNISPSLFNMTQSGKHGDRQLSWELSQKLMDLRLAYDASAKPGKTGTALKKVQERASREAEQQAVRLLTEAKYASSRGRELQYKLEDMIAHHRRALRWLHTVAGFLERLPSTEDTANDRRWFDIQQRKFLQALPKIDELAQLELTVKIEAALAKAKLCKDKAARLRKI